MVNREKVLTLEAFMEAYKEGKDLSIFTTDAPENSDNIKTIHLYDNGEIRLNGDGKEIISMTGKGTGMEICLNCSGETVLKGIECLINHTIKSFNQLSKIAKLMAMEQFAHFISSVMEEGMENVLGSIYKEGEQEDSEIISKDRGQNDRGIVQ